jgi:hypothetical protein
MEIAEAKTVDLQAALLLFIPELWNVLAKKEL